MWEQFSYFGMRALLVYYMTKQLMLGQATSSLIYGTSGSLTAGLVGTLGSRWAASNRNSCTSRTFIGKRSWDRG